jgi:hypothetical protein
MDPRASALGVCLGGAFGVFVVSPLTCRHFLILIGVSFPVFSADLLLKAASASPKAQAEALAKADKVHLFVKTLRTALHNTFRYGKADVYHPCASIRRAGPFVCLRSIHLFVGKVSLLSAFAGCTALTMLTDCISRTERFCRYGQGTRDMAGPDGLTTEKFIDKVHYAAASCGLLLAWCP